MTKDELKNALRPHMPKDPKDVMEGQAEHILVLAKDWFITNQHRPMPEVFEDWNLTVCELLDEIKSIN